MKEQYPKDEFNFEYIWKEQKLPDMMNDFFDELAHKVCDFITDSSDTVRVTSNVTQWCKKDGCWKNMKEKIDMHIPMEIAEMLQLRADKKKAQRKAASVQKFDNNISSLEKVVALYGKWDIIAKDARALKLVRTDKQMKALSTAEKWSRGTSSKMPQEFQASILLTILEQLKDNGKIYE